MRTRKSLHRGATLGCPRHHERRHEAVRLAPGFWKPGSGVQVVVGDVAGDGMSVHDLIRLQVLSEVKPTVDP